MRRRLWWLGDGCMVAGQLLAGFAPNLAAVAVVGAGERTPELPVHVNGPAPGPSDFIDGFSMALAGHAEACR